MIFIDSNVFLHAFLSPKRKLEDHEKMIKEDAIRLVTAIENGFEALTTVVHISEIANILEARTSQQRSNEILEAIISLRNLTVATVSGDLYKNALQTSSNLLLGLNDSLAYLVMKEAGVNIICSFDKHFDQIESIKRLTKIE